MCPEHLAGAPLLTAGAGGAAGSRGLSAARCGGSFRGPGWYDGAGWRGGREGGEGPQKALAKGCFRMMIAIEKLRCVELKDRKVERPLSVLTATGS
jgi:hypothetical protein